jgi:hypothetical protein
MKELPDHLFVTSDGDLHDTRRPDWGRVPLRKQYRYAFQGIQSLAQVKATLRYGSCGWPGGYPLYFTTRDGAALCFDCVEKEFRQIAWDFLNDASTGWRIEGCDINYEDPDLICNHCIQHIASAYADEKKTETK